MPWRIVRLISMPSPWKDTNLRIGLVIGSIFGTIATISQGLIYGFLPAMSILIIYFIVVPWAMKAAYTWGFDACTKAYLQKHAEVIESLDTTWIHPRVWDRAIVVEGETTDTARDPSQGPPRRLP